jgi:uncharacterized protein Usg
MMRDHACLDQMAGSGLSGVQFHDDRPDHRSLLEQFVIQQCDVAPQFSGLDRFIAFWGREIGAVLHAVRVVRKHLFGAREWRQVDAIVTTH